MSKTKATPKPKQAGGLTVSFPEVILATHVKYQLDAYSKIAAHEFSVMGIIEEEKEKNGRVKKLYVSDIHFVEQTNSQSETDMDEQGLAKLVLRLAEEGKGDEGRLKAWIHSHGHMGCFWSTTDEECITNLVNSSESYLVSIVINKKDEYRARIDTYNPVPLTVDNLTVTFEQENPYMGFCKAEYAAKARNANVIQPVGHVINAKGKNGQQKWDWSFVDRGSYDPWDHDYAGIDGINDDIQYTLPGGDVEKKTTNGETREGIETSEADSSQSDEAYDGEFIDIFDVCDLHCFYPQLDISDIAILQTGYVFGVLDDDDYEKCVNRMIEGGRLEKILSEDEYKSAHQQYLNVQGTEDDPMTELERTISYEEAVSHDCMQ
jgi:hypothetical protein